MTRGGLIIVFLAGVLAINLVGWLLSSLVLRVYPDIGVLELQDRVALVLTAIALLGAVILAKWK